MKRTTVSGGAFVTMLGLLVLAQNHRALEQEVNASAAAASPAGISSTASTEEVDQGFLYGRVTTDDGATYVGRLRFGRDEEAFWGDYFNGVKDENSWAAHAQLTQKRRQITIFGFEIPLGDPPIDLSRPFMARFGDIARIEARGREVRVTLKSGSQWNVRTARDHLSFQITDPWAAYWKKRQGLAEAMKRLGYRK